MTTKRLKRPRDPIQLGKLIVDIATGEIEDRQHDEIADSPATEFVRRAGKIGGAARAANLSADRRKEIAKHAAHARWTRIKSGQS
jgi:hypothetical protein